MENSTSGITTAKDDLVYLNDRIVSQVGNNEITVIFDPLSSCTTNELSLLREEVEIGLSGHFNRPGFASDSLYSGVFGLKGRGKILALVRDIEVGTLNALVSGQVLNNDGRAVLFKESRVFHLSLIYSSGGNAIPIWNFLTREILTDGNQRASYFSCFTQNPRIYTMLKRVAGSEIYPITI